MQPIVAYCTGIDTYQKNRLLNISFAKKYPGTSWLPMLSDFLAKLNIPLVTGDIALNNVKTGKWKAKNIIVIQDLDAKDGLILTKLGAQPLVLIALESPLYAYSFYRNIKKIAPIFENRILFSGFCESLNLKKGHDHLVYFPSYNQNEIIHPVKWATRKFLVLVASNKYHQKNFSVKPKYLSEYFDYLKDKFWLWQSLVRQSAVKNELISKRLEAIGFFGPKNLLDIYGAGWNNLDNLPKKWQKSLHPFFKKKHVRIVSDKLKTISNYKFSICFENTSYSGYITEKIIDCFVAGVIPIYLGAPDITKFVPNNSFVDARRFKTLNTLNTYLQNIKENEAQSIISSGRKFLKSPKGKLFSYESNAKFVLELTLKSNPTNHLLRNKNPD